MWIKIKSHVSCKTEKHTHWVNEGETEVHGQLNNGWRQWWLVVNGTGAN